MKREWLRWENIAGIREKVAKRLNLEFTGFSDAVTFYCDPYYYERYYAYFKKKDSDSRIRVAVVEIARPLRTAKLLCSELQWKGRHLGSVQV